MVEYVLAARVNGAAIALVLAMAVCRVGRSAAVVLWCLFLVVVKAAASGCMEVQRRDEGENRVGKGEWIGQGQLGIGLELGLRSGV